MICLRRPCQIKKTIHKKIIQNPYIHFRIEYTNIGNQNWIFAAKTIGNESN